MQVGYAYVVADILHIGHLLHLENCKSFCDKLVVGVLTDEAAMEKKPKPTMPFQDRLRLVSALQCVDMAVPQKKYIPLDNLLEIKPDILFESTDHDVRQYPEFSGRVIVVPRYPHPLKSSTEIKEKIRRTQ